MLQQVVTKYEIATIEFQKIILVIFKRRGNILGVTFITESAIKLRSFRKYFRFFYKIFKKK